MYMMDMMACLLYTYSAVCTIHYCTLYLARSLALSLALSLSLFLIAIALSLKYAYKLNSYVHLNREKKYIRQM